MRKSPWRLIWLSFQEVNGGVLTLAGFLATVLLPRYLQVKVPLDWVVLLLTFSLVISLTLLRSTFKVHEELRRRLNPRILSAEYIEGQKIWCLLERSQLFAHDTVVSFYYTSDNGFEVLIGWGYVLHIQGDGRIQVLIEQFETSYLSVIESLVKDKEIREKIQVQPGIPRTYI